MSENDADVQHENDVKPSRNSVHQRLLEFCYYFFLTVDENFQYSLDILEGNPNDEIKTSSLPGSALAALAMAIPTVGKGVSAAVKEVDKFVLKKLDKKKAALFSKLVYNFRDNKESFRGILVEAAACVFQSYEVLFMQLNCKGGPTKAMQKLAEDATHRFISHLVENIIDEFLIPDIVIKGVLFGRSSGVLKSGRTFTNGDLEMKSSKIYTKVGVVVKKNDEILFYKNLSSNTKKYGYRLVFVWEDLSDWELEEGPSEYKSELQEVNIVEKVPTILQYIITKNPLQEIKNIQETTHETTVQLIEEKHMDLKNDIKMSQIAIIETIETKHQEVIEATEEKHEKINQNLSELKVNDIKLEEETKVLKEEITEIKKKTGDENKIPILINKNELQKIEREVRRVKEDLAKNDPGPALKKAEKELRKFVKKKIKF